MADRSALSKLVKKADAVAESASALVQKCIREIRGELSVLANDTNISGSAKARDDAYAMIRGKMSDLSRRLDRLLYAQQQLAARSAADSASDMTGLEIKYSPRRAEAICEMVTPAQGESLAAVFTDKMASNLIHTLREATVAVMRENAVAGGGMKQMAAAMRDRWFDAVKDGVPRFVDSSGREWNTAAYFQMNVRTNTMRVYNDCLVDDVARETGCDIMRISSGGSDASCECASWEGTLVSVTGKTKGLPTYDQAREGGCFHPNCVHTLEAVDEYADADEIEMAKAHPFNCGEHDDIWEVQDERKYEIDQAVKMRDEGLTKEEARIAVDRDNLEAAIRTGLVRDDAREIVAAMTDAQVTAMCPNGNPPEFQPFKPTKRELKDGAKEKWNHGRRGGVVHIAKDATADDILRVCKVADAKDEPPEKDVWKPTTELEKATDKLMAEIGAKHTDEHLTVGWRDVNPDYKPNSQTSINCQRCSPTIEARLRGYDVVALPKPKGNDDFYRDSKGNKLTGYSWLYPAYKNPKPIAYKTKADIEKQMAAWGDGARAEIGIAWKGGGSHSFFAIQKDGKTIFCDSQGYGENDRVARNAARFFINMSPRGTRARVFNNFCRVDNLEFSERAKLAFRNFVST